jgi:hypothetical protein
MQPLTLALRSGFLPLALFASDALVSGLGVGFGRRRSPLDRMRSIRGA